jgi:uncharacterized membrane protein
VSIADSVVRRVVREPDWTRADNLLGVAIALFAGVVLVDMAGIELGLIRPVVVVPFLSLIPGYLLLGILRVEPRDATTGVLYSLGLSLCFLMGYGLVLNTALPELGIEAVFTESVLFVATLGGVGALLAVYSNRSDIPQVDTAGFVDVVWRPWPLALLCVPFLTILGARTVTRFGNNGPILAVLAGLGLLVAVAYLGGLPKRYFPLAVWVIAVSLLLHISVISHYVVWDVGKELRLATVVVDNGVWDASVGGRWMKNAMLRIVLLHPIYALLSDIDLLWEFKTVGPMLFAFAPVALYRSYRATVDRSDAFLSVLLPMSFFPFFTVLSLNSRTNGALLFLSLIAVVLTDRTIGNRKRHVLAVVFFSGLVVSHYATAYLVLIATGLVLAGNWVLFGPRRTTKRMLITPPVILLFGLITFLWYEFVVYQGAAFGRLVFEMFTFSSDLWGDLVGDQGVVSGEESTTANYASTTYTSDTIRWLRSLNFVLGGLAGLSVAALGLQRLWVRLREGGNWAESAAETARTEHLLYAAGFLGVFGATFLGIDKLNTGRTLMPALFLFAPFVVLSIRGAGNLLRKRFGVVAIKRVSVGLALGFVLVYFVLNVGLYGAVTEEYHPNVMIDKDRVMDGGSLAEKDYYYAMSLQTIYDRKSGEWLESGERDDSGYYRYGSRKVIGGMYNCTDIVRQPVVRQGSCDDGPSQEVESMDKVYASAGSHVFYNRSE